MRVHAVPYRSPPGLSGTSLMLDAYTKVVYLW